METNEGLSLSELNECLLTTLQCHICCTLMRGEIHQCKNGHHICNECKNKLTQCPTCRGEYSGTRNFLGEEIASLVTLLGTAKLDDEALPNQKDCEFLSFRYRIGGELGSWNISDHNLIEHLTNVKSSALFEKNMQKVDPIPYNCGKFFEQTTQIKVFGKLFFWHYIQDPESGIYHTFQHIGAPSEQNQFRFEIQYSHPWGCPSVSYSNFTCSLEDDVYNLCQKSECFHLSFRRFESMLQNKVINFDFNVLKNEN